MIEGSCCCGAVRFALKSEPSMMGTCHCSRCRKLGASTFVFIKRDSLVWHEGREHVATYAPQSPYKYARCFCSKCGTSLGEILSEDESFPIAANVLDDPISVRNAFHEFVAEKPDWYRLCDDAPRYDGHPKQ